MKKQRTYCLCLLVGILLLVGGIGENIYTALQNKGRATTDATILSVHYQVADPENVEAWFLIGYQANGITYETKIDFYDSRYIAGSKMTISYAIENPTDVKSVGTQWNFSIFFIAAGGVFIVAPTLPFLLCRKKERKIARLIRCGVCLQAEIVAVNVNMRVRRHPYFILCRAGEDNTTYRSENIPYDPREELARRGIKTLPVYQNPTDKTDYYVDLQSLLR